MTFAPGMPRQVFEDLRRNMYAEVAVSGKER